MSLPKSLPQAGPLEAYAQMRAALDKPAFLAALPGPAVLIRLDERGGEDEPAPWAFQGPALCVPIEVSSSDPGVFVDRTGKHVHLATDDSTLTGPTYRLSIPAARGRATVHVVPAGALIVVGRDPACGVCVNERSVSREHAKLIVEGQASGERVFFVAAAGGHKGVFVNGKRLADGQTQRLASGDVVDLRDVSLLFLDASELYDGIPRLTA